MTYGEEYDKLMKEAHSYLENAENVSLDGDLWSAHIDLVKAKATIEGMISLIQKVSKTAFERVMNERAK